MSKTIRLVAVNALVFLSLWISIVAIIAVAGDIWGFWLKPLTRGPDKRAALPAYSDRELAERVFRDQKAADFDYVPFVEWRHKAHASETLNIDANGRRVHRADETAAVGGTAIGFFGGSTMWGTGVDDNGTIPAFFDHLTDGYQVTNYGERGYTSRQNLDDLISLAVTRKVPEIVVFYSGYNDVWVHCNYGITRHLSGHMREGRLAEALAAVEGDKSLVHTAFVEPVVAFIGQILPRTKREDEFACSSDPKRAEAVAQMIVENWTIAEQIVTRNGGEFYAFLQPNAYVGSPRTDYLGLSDSRLARDKEFQVVYPLVQRKIALLPWAKDLSDAFDGDQPVYIDDAHVGPQGNRIIAARINGVIAARGRGGQSARIGRNRKTPVEGAGPRPQRL